MAWVKIALRNLIKNRRRSAITGLAIALGFAAVNLFAGFTEYMYDGNRKVAIFGAAGGHLTIFKEGFLEAGQLNPARYLLTPVEISAVEEIARIDPHIELVSPQLRITGLVTNGKVSTIFIAQGIVPSVADFFMSRIDILELVAKDRFKGKKLQDDQMYGVAVTRGLARLLDLKLGSDAVAFSNTVDGQMNALNLEVFQLFDASSELMNDKLMRVPLSFARALYDTEGADRLAVLLDKTENTILIRDYLLDEFSRRGLSLEIKTWKEMSAWYRKVKNLFDVVFVFLFTIVFIIVVMSVVNTMTMAVVERTREIGTLRALGIKRRGIELLFSLESCLLGIFGAFGGLILTFVGWLSVDIIEPTWIPPGIVSRVPIRIEFVPESMLFSFIFLTALCMAASFFPSRRAAKMNVVDALGHI